MKNNEILTSIKEILNSLTPQILDACNKELSECLPELEKIWMLVSEMTKEDLS